MATVTSRRCGNCGQPVGATDITCPQCDALLAAYEAPSGATAGTDAAITPVDAATTIAAPAPAQEPVAAAVTATPEAPVAPEPEPLPTVDTTPRPSPVAEALEETKAAVDATPQPTTEAERQAVAAIEAQIQAENPPVGKATAASMPQTRPAPPPERPTPRVEADVIPSSLSEALPESVRRVREQQRQGWSTQSTPERAGTPETKAQPASPRVTELLQQPRARISTTPRSTRPTTKSAKPGQSYGWLIVIFVLFMFMRGAGSNAFFGVLLTFGAIALVIWLLVRFANATGRKTTRMPRDDKRR